MICRLCLATAGILPAWLAHTAEGVPRRVILLNTIVQVALILCIYFVGEAVWDIINLASIMCGLFHYISIFASYIYMKRNYQVRHPSAWHAVKGREGTPQLGPSRPLTCVCRPHPPACRPYLETS